MKNTGTTVAALRKFLGLKQISFANLVNRSEATIQSVELGRLTLSESLAEEISKQTGVSVKWLMDGDPNARIETRWSTKRPFAKHQINEFVDAAMSGLNHDVYSKELFEAVQARLKSNLSDQPWGTSMIRSQVAEFVLRYHACLLSAISHDRYDLFAYKAEKALSDIAKEFGEDERLENPRFSYGSAAEVCSEADKMLRALLAQKKPPTPPSKQQSSKPRRSV